MVQGIRQNLVKTHRPKILHTGRDSRHAVGLLQTFMAVQNRRRGVAGPTWITADAGHPATINANCLVITELDMFEHHNQKRPVPWLDINVIVIETYWQLSYYQGLIDRDRSYVLITDTWMSEPEFDRHFSWLRVLARFSFKFDAQEIFRILGQGSPEWNVCDISLPSKPYQTFALVGRQDRYRDGFVAALKNLGLEGALIRYQGEIIHNTARDFDTRPYNSHEFAQPGGYQNSVGSFEIMPGFYEQYRFETVIETTQWHTGGWPFVEYNISEKTLKPVMVGVPAAILAPPGYHAWLQAQYGIDPTLAVFDSAWDHEPSDNARMQAMVTAVGSLARHLDQEPDAAAVAQNRRALMSIQDRNVQDIRRCADFLLGLV